jgi:hypothetical protein
VSNAVPACAVLGLWSVGGCLLRGGGLDGKEDWLRDMVGLLRHGR